MSADLKKFGKYLEKMDHSVDCEVNRKKSPEGCICGFAEALEVMTEVQALRRIKELAKRIVVVNVKTSTAKELRPLIVMDCEAAKELVAIL